MLIGTMKYLEKFGEFYGLFHARDYEMFLKGYCIANILYSKNNFDKDIVVIDALIEQLCSVTNNSKSWGYYFIAQHLNYKKSRTAFFQYWSISVDKCSQSTSCNYLKNLQNLLEGCATYIDFMHFFLNNILLFELVDAHDFDSMFTGIMFYNIELDISASLNNFPSPTPYTVPNIDPTFFSIWDEDFRQFVQKYASDREYIITVKGSYALGSYCTFMASKGSITFLHGILEDYIDEKIYGKEPLFD